MKKIIGLLLRMFLLFSILLSWVFPNMNYVEFGFIALYIYLCFYIRNNHWWYFVFDGTLFALYIGQLFTGYQLVWPLFLVFMSELFMYILLILLMNQRGFEFRKISRI